MRRLIALAALLLMLLAALPAAGDNTPGITVAIAGPERAEATGTAAYNVKIYGPENIRWGFSVNMTGKNRSGGSLTSPDGTADPANSFLLTQAAPLAYPEFNLTMTSPSKAGAIVLTVDVYAIDGTGAAGQHATAMWSINVKPKRAVKINATVSNGGSAAVENVRVAFQVRLNGEWSYISNESIPSILAGKKENVSTVWNASLLDPGEYKVRILIDPEHEKAQYSGAQNMIEKTVVLKEVGAKEAWTPSLALVGLVIFLIIAGIGMAYWYQKKKIV